MVLGAEISYTLETRIYPCIPGTLDSSASFFLRRPSLVNNTSRKRSRRVCVSARPLQQYGCTQSNVPPLIKIDKDRSVYGFFFCLFFFKCSHCEVFASSPNRCTRIKADKSNNDACILSQWCPSACEPTRGSSGRRRGVQQWSAWRNCSMLFPRRHCNWCAPKRSAWNRGSMGWERRSHTYMSVSTTCT